MKIRTLILCILISQISFGQKNENENENIIELAKIYHEFHTSNPTDETFEKLKTIEADQLKTSIEFIDELIREKNKIATRKYLSKPDSVTLKKLYIIRAVNYNMFEAIPKDNNDIIDSISTKTINYHELLSCYYGMLFTTITNKNRPLKMSKYNFNLSDYNLINESEKGIFFLKSMETFGILIWGLLNVPDPPNYKKALKIINNYPKYNGQPYYEFTNLNFDDFMIKIDKSRPKESFKSYYINKYMNTVVSHSLCLMQNEKTKKKAYRVILKSIVKNEKYWKYSSSPDFFERTFKNIKE